MIQPRETDILCGKDRQSISYPGSRNFRNLIDTYAIEYANAPSKFDKMRLTKEIYERVRQTSRFLKFNDKQQAWEEISMMAARDKVGHALRFARRAKRRLRKNDADKMKVTHHHRRNGSISSLSSSESDSQQHAPHHHRNSLVEHLQMGLIGTTLEPLVEPEMMPPLKPSFQQWESQTTSDHERRSSGMDIDADELLLLLQEDRSPCDDFLDSFTDEIGQVIRNIDGEQRDTMDDGAFSLMQEPLGDWTE